jgi:hypothetical protein
MRWFPTISHAAPPAPPRADRQARTETIRRAFTESLQATNGPAARGLSLRVQCAVDAVQLWHLRPEAMRVLASLHGEAQASAALARITDLFQGVLPDGLDCRLRPHHPSRCRETLKESA